MEDTAHIHNHIIFNSTSMDCRGKFRDFLGSGKAVARLSDLICLEHGLSVIENPKRGGNSYKSWLGDRAGPPGATCCARPLTRRWYKSPRTLTRCCRSYPAQAMPSDRAGRSLSAARDRSRVSGWSRWAKGIRRLNCAL